MYWKYNLFKENVLWAFWPLSVFHLKKKLLWAKISIFLQPGWAFYFLISSARSELPWVHCDNSWNTEQCWDSGRGVNGTSNRTDVRYQGPLSHFTPASEFFQWVEQGDFTKYNFWHGHLDYHTYLLRKSYTFTHFRVATVKWKEIKILNSCLVHV